MNFFQAMEALEDGKKIKNDEWKATDYIYVDEEDGLIKDQDNKHIGLVMASDTTIDIWEVYEEFQENLSFDEILPLLLEGKKFKRKDWTVGYIFLLTNAGHIFHRVPGSVLAERWTPRTGDFTSQDWVEVRP